MHIYSTLLDIIPYFVVAGVGMTFFALVATAIAFILEAGHQADSEQISRLHERLRYGEPSPALLTRQPLTDQDEEARIQKQLAAERERLRKLKEKES